MNESEIKTLVERVALYHPLKERELKLLTAYRQLTQIPGNDSAAWQVCDVIFESADQQGEPPRFLSIIVCDINIYEICEVLAPLVKSRLDAVRKEIEEL